MPSKIKLRKIRRLLFSVSWNGHNTPCIDNIYAQLHLRFVHICMSYCHIKIKKIVTRVQLQKLPNNNLFWSLKNKENLSFAPFQK